MSWIVPFNGKDLEVDPLLLNGFEMGLIKQRTGLSWRKLLEAIMDFDGDAIRALFWAAERRIDETIKFTDYAGPTMELVLEHLGGLTAAVSALEGKVDSLAKTNGMTTSPSSQTDGTSDGTVPGIQL